MNIYSFSPFGYEGALVTVEVDLRRGIPAIDMVGLADGAVKESRERMQAAIRNSGFDFPPERVLISLSPADLKKEGAGFDLPVALAVLAANAEGGNFGHGAASVMGAGQRGQAMHPTGGQAGFLSEPILIMGELELSGKIRPVKGVHAAVSTAAEAGIFRCIVPSQNADEAREAEGVQVYGADTLKNAFLALSDSSFYQSKKEASGTKEIEEIPAGCEEVDGMYFPKISAGFEFADLKGQEKLVRGLQIAAAGGHNFMAVGAPGCGKTMAIQMFPAINPVLTMEEAQSVTRIWSLAGLIKPDQPLVRIPPFRMPHQTATIEGICGGGTNCRPGEISLAHHGVLFLDEAAEFRSSVLQMLRVPIESEQITLSRAGRNTTYPAKFQLFMAVNPCPCGNFGSKTKLCLCSAKSIDLYWKKFSAPLLDRIDLQVFVENTNEEEVSLDEVAAMAHQTGGSAWGAEGVGTCGGQAAETTVAGGCGNGGTCTCNDQKKLSQKPGGCICEENIETVTDCERRQGLRTTEEIRMGVARAVKIQRSRQGCRNAKLSPAQIEEVCNISKGGQQALEAATNRYGFSPRAIASIVKTARTIADIDGAEEIRTEDVKEAVGFRKLCVNLVPDL